MRLAALCSGGKDSALAIWRAMRSGHEISEAIIMIPQRVDSWMYHHPNIRLARVFAECSDIPSLEAETSGEKEKEVGDLERVLRGLDVEGVVSGAIASTYQKTRIDKICEKLGLEVVAPLWGEDPLRLLFELLGEGFKVIITSVSSEGLGEEWLGRTLDRRCVEDLVRVKEKYGINLVAEGGEYETLVLDAPFFSRRIELLEADRVWDGVRGYLSIKRVKTVEKI